MNRILSILCCLAVAMAGGATSAYAVDWAAIFNPNGTVRDLQGGIEAVFLEDNISAGIATDMTALAATDGVVYNGPVAAAHDLGNGYVYATLDATQRLIISAGVERLNSTADTFVEIEFNQGVVGVYSGNPWPVLGSRTPNDILVRMNFVAGVLSTAELMVWDGAAFAAAGPGALTYAIGAPIPGLPPTNADVWDGNFQKVIVPSADSFVEAGINVGLLFGSNIEFTSIVMRTPSDIVLGSFQAMGNWKRVP